MPLQISVIECALSVSLRTIGEYATSVDVSRFHQDDEPPVP